MPQATRTLRIFVSSTFNDLKEERNALQENVWWDREAMESRGRTFLQEIRDAIEGSGRLIAVIGPNAVKSAYVRTEWEYALLFCKGVVPVLCKGDHNLIPPDLSKLHCRTSAKSVSIKKPSKSYFVSWPSRCLR